MPPTFRKCPDCGYSLAAIEGRCPECGRHFSLRLFASADRERLERSKLAMGATVGAAVMLVATWLAFASTAAGWSSKGSDALGATVTYIISPSGILLAILALILRPSIRAVALLLAAAISAGALATIIFK